MAYRSGALCTLNAKRSIPSSKILSNPINPVTLNTVHQRIPILVDTGIGLAHLNLALSFYISRFYHEIGHHNINTSRLAVAIAGIIGSCSDFRQIDPWLPVVKAYRTAGITIEFVPLNKAEFSQLVNNDQRWRDFISKWREDLGYILEDTKMMYILSCVIILCIFKRLNEKNYIQWFTRRIVAFSGTVGDTYTIANLTEQDFPPLDQLEGLFIFVNAYHPLRKELYIQIASMASRKSGFISAGMLEIHNMCRGLEMQHLIMIDTYIFQEHPEFLSLNCLRGLKPCWTAVLDKLRKFPIEEVLYSRILEDKDECAILGRRLFDMAATVATTIAQFNNSTFNNFYINESPAHERLKLVVLEYLSMRLDLVPMAAGTNSASFMTQEEKELFIKNTEIKFNLRMTESKAETKGDDLIPLPTAIMGI